MSVAVVSFKDLGSNCWSAVRLTTGCHACQRYDTCTYPERVPTPAYDQLRSDAAALKAQSDAIYARARNMRGY